MRNNRSEIRAVVAVVVLLAVVTLGYTGLYLWLIARFTGLLPVRVLIVLAGAVNIVMCLVVLRQRIREIQKGEEHDLGKY
ncbi:hypothetical protein [Spirochaeta africana]|uniref:Uncharacterized protein n=1 Tax=Spirochaeta africana (strain ATCC 700263 / DSM 8902 / Z-7692) TaxID=889378 RepID=H9UHQ7_SPIAZ|nr:hypothetical protein [Spirochaeta africana]AFG37050.1 hypothetical protein Spiaf_0961 [Spirochaeta africana DSM 8902]